MHPHTMPVTCPTHGQQRVEMVLGPPWFCPVCNAPVPVDVAQLEADEREANA